MELTSDHYSLGKTAYDAYCKQTGGKSLISGAPLPPFEGLNQSIKDAWAAAAIGVSIRVEARSRNYTASDAEMPDSVTFANGRTVSIVDNKTPGVQHGVFLKVT